MGDSKLIIEEFKCLHPLSAAGEERVVERSKDRVSKRSANALRQFNAAHTLFPRTEERGSTSVAQSG